jgi:phosphosulfolactate phosphohydrolase-like enzyme
MIDVAGNRAELRSAGIAVVIDVLRATSTATQALAAGYRRVLCAESIARAAGLRAPGRVLAGERRCLRPPGFDQGNSPLEAATRRGDELVLRRPMVLQRSSPRRAGRRPCCWRACSISTP